ncbi:MAG: hypothetical protein IPJ81_16055 [Chitinophagaceae bacterium]|nr:hypothetical protein [Chitinophagaceae bacterium]
MKKILFLAAITCLSLSSFSQKLINRNITELEIKNLTTTNATATKVDSLVITPNEVGFITIKAVGFSADSVAAVTGIRTYRYTKVAGTLTLGSVIETQAPVADTKVSGATFTAVASSNNIVIKATGKADVSMKWYFITKQYGAKKE